MSLGWRTGHLSQDYVSVLELGWWLCGAEAGEGEHEVDSVLGDLPCCPPPRGLDIRHWCPWTIHGLPLGIPQPLRVLPPSVPHLYHTPVPIRCMLLGSHLSRLWKYSWAHRGLLLLLPSATHLRCGPWRRAGAAARQEGVVGSPPGRAQDPRAQGQRAPW